MRPRYRRAPPTARPSRAVPGTGPYEIVAASNTQVRFARNPYFREWSHAAQPVGNPDSIVWRSVASIQAAVNDIERGQPTGCWAKCRPPNTNSSRCTIRHRCTPTRSSRSSEITVPSAVLNAANRLLVPWRLLRRRRHRRTLFPTCWLCRADAESPCRTRDRGLLRSE